jgi:hypothetical protein
LTLSLTQRKEKGKHGKFEALWISPFKISKVFSNNTYKLENLEDVEVFGGHVNGHFLKKHFSLAMSGFPCHCKYHLYFIFVLITHPIALG